MSGNDEEEHVVQGTSLLEWVVACVGALFLASTIGYLVFQGVSKEEGPPDIGFETGRAETSGGGYLVRFTARNRGYSTASAVEISGRLMQGDIVVEESRATLDHLPEQSARQGGLFFSRNPADFDLRVRAEGYASP
jgi:uncharacterized protein (TIGR02588 family)